MEIIFKTKKEATAVAQEKANLLRQTWYIFYSYAFTGWRIDSIPHYSFRREFPVYKNLVNIS